MFGRMLDGNVEDEVGEKNAYHELVNSPSVAFDRVPNHSFLIEFFLQLTAGPAAGSHIDGRRVPYAPQLFLLPGAVRAAHVATMRLVEMGRRVVEGTITDAGPYM